jgi:excisionase family DNA binding protein
VARTLYSTEDVAGILGLHVRTVRGYVRDGRLPATRIGKQYRIARDDLNAFTATHPGPPADDGTSQPPRAEASAVVQVAPLGPGAMSRLATLVTGAASARQDGEDPLHVQTVYDPLRATLKVIVTGTADDTATVLALISTLTREQA